MNKSFWWCVWGAGIILWLIILIQFIVADNDTVILKQDPDKNAPSKEIIKDIHDTTTVVSSPGTDTISNKRVNDPNQEDQKNTSGQPGQKDNCININTADNEELVSLSGIGPVLADRIILFREKNGNFTKPSDLVKVKGIGEGKLKKIIAHICF